MKILQLGKFYPVQGGVEKVMYDLMTGLTQEYTDVICDMMCVAAAPQPKVRKLGQHSTLYCAKLNKKLFSTMLSFDLIGMLRKQCNNYDIIHIHHPDPMAALALKLSGFRGKVVLHWHSDILKQKLLLNFYRPLQNWLIRRSDVIIGTTPKYMEQSSHLFSCKKEKIAIPIGIMPVISDKSKARKIRSAYSNKRIVFSLGRLVGYKGFEYLIDAANYLGDEYVILIGGSGPLKDILQNRIENSGFSNKVKLLGHVNDEELPAYYEASNLFVLSSIWKTEAFGIVQIEAMSCGKPVVATHIPESGVDWVNKDGYSGINVEPENSKAIADAIKKINASREIYLQFSTNAKNRFEELFTLPQMIHKCRAVYDKLI